MAKVYKLAARQAEKAQKGEAVRGSRRHKRRWNPAKCVPLVALAWVLGAIAFMPLWLYFFSWYWTR